MSDVTPSTRVSGAASGQAQPIGLPASITNPPQAVAGLAVGTLLRGVVQGRDSHNHAVVRTELGTLLVASAAKLSSGNHVALQIRAAGSELLVSILRVDGHVPQDAGTASPPLLHQSPAASSIGSPASTASAALPEVVLSLGQTLRAVVQGAPNQRTGPSAVESNLPVLTPGSRLQVKVVEILTPRSTSPLTPGAQGTAVLQPPPGPLGERTGSPEGRLQIQSLVTGSAAKGHPVVQSPLGTLTLNVSAALPPGTHLVLELAAADLDQYGGATARSPERAASLAYRWPALQEALQALQANAGANSQPPLALRGVPQPGPRLSSGILFFFQALGGGSLDGWLGGHTVEALERAGRGGLASRLAQEFTQLGRLVETAGGEWRFLPIPLYDGSELHQLRLFLRERAPRSKNSDGREDDDTATRFVVDLQHSRLGALQLDGLVRESRFDLMLRSRRSLSETMRRDITAIFDEANNAAGYGGQISFQAAEDWRPLALEQAKDDAANLVV